MFKIHFFQVLNFKSYIKLIQLNQVAGYSYSVFTGSSTTFYSGFSTGFSPSFPSGFSTGSFVFSISSSINFPNSVNFSLLNYATLPNWKKFIPSGLYIAVYFYNGLSSLISIANILFSKRGYFTCKWPSLYSYDNDPNK